MKRMLSCLALVALASACGNSAPPSTPAVEPPTAPAAPKDPMKEMADGGAPKSGAVKAPGDATLGDRTKCPVSGEEFTVDAKSPKAMHAGKTYYFCCDGCDKKFSKDPEKYLGKPKS